ncbi:MAG: DinB/UmuC family translesion DNA polymerase, partial [Candidatus Oleimicrobiaceae bacterium]
RLIGSTALDLFLRFDCCGKKVRLLGVGVSGLVRAASSQLSLFEHRKPDKIDEVTDKVRTRFGEGAIFRASALGKRQPRRSDSGSYRNDT